MPSPFSDSQTIMVKKSSLFCLQDSYEYVKYKTKTRNAWPQSYVKRFQFPENKKKSAFILIECVDCLVTEISPVTSFYKNQCLLLSPGWALRSRESLVFCVPCPSMSQYLTLKTGIGSVEDSFFLLLPILLLYLYSPTLF